MKKIILTALIFIYINKSFCQQLPWAWCGIVNVYDPAGNRTKRVYFCQNGDPYPMKSPPLLTEEKKQQNETVLFEPVEALFPNPTTGKVYMTFSNELSKATLTILNNSGELLKTFIAKGYETNFDLSSYPAGMYYIRIEQNGKVISKKVIKQ